MDFAVIVAPEIQEAAAFAVALDLRIVADDRFRVFVRRDLLDQFLFQPVLLGVALDVVDRAALIEDDVFLLLQVALLFVGEVNSRVVDDLRVEVAVVKIDVGIA